MAQAHAAAPDAEYRAQNYYWNVERVPMQHAGLSNGDLASLGEQVRGSAPVAPRLGDRCPRLAPLCPCCCPAALPAAPWDLAAPAYQPSSAV